MDISKLQNLEVPLSKPKDANWIWIVKTYQPKSERNRTYRDAERWTQTFQTHCDIIMTPQQDTRFPLIGRRK